MFRASLSCRKIATLFADLHSLRDRVGGADFMLRYYFIIGNNFCVLFILKSAPCRLSPIEALPQAPQGALPLDPTSPLTPGLSLRLSARYARCLCTTLFSYANSSFLIPHSSFSLLTAAISAILKSLSVVILKFIASPITRYISSPQAVNTEQVSVSFPLCSSLSE